MAHQKYDLCTQTHDHFKPHSHIHTHMHTHSEPPRHTCASTSSWRARMGAKVPDHGQTSDSTCVCVYVCVCVRGDIYNEIIPCDLPHTPVQLPIHTHAHAHTHKFTHMHTHAHTRTPHTLTHNDVIPREPLARMSSSPPHHEQE